MLIHDTSSYRIVQPNEMKCLLKQSYHKFGVAYTHNI